MISAGPDLNADQLRAVEHPAGPLLVLAGPGTGKTGVLIERISHLVGERNVNPERVLALTFSRRAADEMRNRTTARVPEAEKVEVRTFHSFALSVVRRHAGALGLRSAPEIVPTGEQWALVSDILGDEDPAAWGLPPGAFERPATVREVYDLLLRAQEHLLEPTRLRELGDKTGRPYLDRAGGVLRRYRDRLGSASKADYEGVVQYALRLLIPGGKTAAEISGLYDHVLVDEFQDTNRSQMELLKRLMPGEKPNVFCVGDDAQSIYGFRGARIQNVREFEDRFPGAREIHLRTNYRSAAHIVSLAEQAIAGDESRPPRDPQTVSSVGKLGTVLHRVAVSPREEGGWIADRIVELTQGEGVPREEIAVLRRSLLDAAPLVEALASRGIPVDVSVSPGGSSARHLATLLAACADPDPTPASGALVSPLCGVSAEAARALRVSAEASGRSVFGLLRSGDSVGGVPEEEMEGARAVVRAADEAGREESFAANVDSLWKGLPATKDLFERHAEDEEAARALTDALAFVRSAHAYARMSQRPTVQGFLRAGKMLHEDSDTWAPSAPPAEGAVRLLTVHGSKGLEFEAVFVSGLVDERFPIRRWEDELSGLRRDAENIPERPRPKHVLPPPETHSPSSLMELETCARRYYYTHVFPVPYGSEKMEESQDYGSAVHAWIEGGMIGDPPKAEVPSDAVGDGADRRPAGDFKNSDYAVRASSYPLHEGRELPEVGPARMVEVPFAVEIGGAEVRGRIDAVFLDEDGAVHLIDWKTGRPRESYAKRLQLPLYALAANRLWGVEPERMRLAYVFVPGGETVEVEMGEGSLESAEGRVLKALETIRAGAYEPTPSRYACSHCPVMGVVIEGCPEEVPAE